MEALTGEILNINNEYSTYQEYKAAVDCELQKSAESFVRIGYLLKVARDTDILKESGYKSVNEFAKSEYGLDKSQVSRFIRINDEYSENGYSDRLQERYREFGYAKLALMLMLPAAVNEELSAAYSKSEIQEIKEEVDAERKITDVEIMLEGQDSRQELMESGLEKVLYQIGHDYPDIYEKLHVCLKDSADVSDKISAMKETLAPAGENVYSVRIQGIGRMMVFFRESDDNITITNLRSSDKEMYTWQQAYEVFGSIIKIELSFKESWMEVYGEQFPEVAPVQPSSKVEKGKTSRVSRAVTESKQKKKMEKKAPEAESNQAVSSSDKDGTASGQESRQGKIADESGIEDSQEAVEEKEAVQETDSKFRKEMLQCARISFSNLQTAMEAKAYKAALEDAKHLVHYLEKALEEDGNNE